MSEQRDEKKGGSVVSALCRIIGIIFILIVIVTAIPLTVPTLFGYQIFNVETGSMYPAIPEGSVIYVQYQEPNTIPEGEVITYGMEGATITHRVVANRIVEGEFITKGDANENEDMSPVPYSSVIGVVKQHFPVLGKFLVVYGTFLGKIYVLAFAACGVLLNILGSMLKKR